MNCSEVGPERVGPPASRSWYRLVAVGRKLGHPYEGQDVTEYIRDVLDIMGLEAYLQFQKDVRIARFIGNGLVPILGTFTKDESVLRKYMLELMRIAVNDREFACINNMVDAPKDTLDDRWISEMEKAMKANARTRGVEFIDARK